MALDTLKFARKLQEAGMPAQQAEAQAEAIQEPLESPAVTKGDLADHRAEISAEFAKVRAEIGNMRTELHTEIGNVRTELHTEVGNVRAEIAELRAKFGLLYWMVGFNLALTASVLAKLLIVR